MANSAANSPPDPDASSEAAPFEETLISRISDEGTAEDAGSVASPAPRNSPPAEGTGRKLDEAVDAGPREPRLRSSTRDLPTRQLGEFDLERRLGEGGMGEVFLATQRGLNRRVAIKTIKPELAKNADLVERFQREARVLAMLEHPNIVRCYAVGFDRGWHYVALEFVDGRTLKQWLEELGSLSVPDALHIAITCAAALATAHDAGVIHRDIKPDNLLIHKNGMVKIADLGLAKLNDEELGLTQTGVGMGTPLYMAPEQSSDSKRVDQRCDIYALGVTLYRMLTGASPFSGNTAVELVIAKQKGKFTPAKRLNPGIPERLDLMLDKMLAANPAHRYANCDDLLRDLKSLGLAAPSLSFIDHPSGDSSGKNVRTLGVPEISAPRVPVSTFSMPDPNTSTNFQPGAVNQELRGKEPQDEPTIAGDVANGDDANGAIWYVERLSSSSGKTKISRYTTAQIAHALKKELLSPQAPARRGESGPFQPVGGYPEFRGWHPEVSQPQSTVIQQSYVEWRKKEAKQRQQAARDSQPQFYERGWFYGLMLALLTAFAVWMCWPWSEEQFFAKAQPLMASKDADVRRQARDQYLLPMLERFPSGKHAVEAGLFLDELEMEKAESRIKANLRLGREPKSDAERMYVEGYRFEKLGDSISAGEKYRRLLELFTTKADQPYRNLARRQLTEIEQTSQPGVDRGQLLAKILDDADSQFERGEIQAARGIWKSVAALYAGDPQFARYVERARQRLDRSPAQSTVP